MSNAETTSDIPTISEAAEGIRTGFVIDTRPSKKETWHDPTDGSAMEYFPIGLFRKQTRVLVPLGSIFDLSRVPKGKSDFYLLDEKGLSLLELDQETMDKLGAFIATETYSDETICHDLTEATVKPRSKLRKAIGMFWERTVKPEQTHKLKAGQVIRIDTMDGVWRRRHSALYVGEGICISKLGQLPIFATTLEALWQHYREPGKKQRIVVV